MHAPVGAARLPFCAMQHMRRARQQDTDKVCSPEIQIRANDPSAGSPTETLLRLLLPLSDKVHKTSQCNINGLMVATV